MFEFKRDHKVEDEWASYGISWDMFNDYGITGTSNAHLYNGNDEDPKTLCGMELSPTSGMREGWGLHMYNGADSASGTCARCFKAWETFKKNAEIYEKNQKEINACEKNRDFYNEILEDVRNGSAFGVCESNVRDDIQRVEEKLIKLRKANEKIEDKYNT